MKKEEQIEMFHKMGFKGLVVDKKTGIVVASSASCTLAHDIVRILGSEYEYKESY